ncbi:hypothetical protein PPYR_08573 [Photinus pyralis]|uniref:Uncharacterized protein n=2 Tax=Photinus pyralis TaxID=7054 RepID=A0A5N4AJR5_PHOPY|nr:uncharacterized protein LOC116171698 [Photinus pyralis]KAB0797580.1 hypothetical protein PPYR_08573 [Photinus pyralis]
MKFLIIMLLLVFAQQRCSSKIISDWEIGLEKYSMKCANETNLDPTISKRILREFYMPDERNFQCFLKCIMENSGVLKSSHEVDIQELIELPQHLIDDWNAVQNPHREKCVNLTKIDPSLPERLLTEMHVPDDDGFKCYLKCVLENVKVIVGNDIDVDTLSAVVHMTRDLSEKCANATRSESDACRKSFILTGCVLQNQL